MRTLNRQQGRHDPARNAQKETPRHQGHQGRKQTISGNSEGNTSKAQRQRILLALKRGPLTTLQARHDLDVLHPAARVQELRGDGHRIATIWRADDTGQASRHRVACYVYQGEAK